MILVHAAIAAPEEALPVIPLRVERRQLAKRHWRGTAEDGTEFGFQSAAPLPAGATIFQTERQRYVLEQRPETVLTVNLAELPPSAAAGVGWAIGNLHLELQAEVQRLLTPDEPAARQVLARLGLAFASTTAVFRPGRFVRGAPAVTPQVHELGTSHRH